MKTFTSKLKPRHYIALTIVLLSIVATPFAFIHAYEFRGGFGVGSEWFVLPSGAILAWAVCKMGYMREEAQKAKEGRYWDMN